MEPTQNQSSQEFYHGTKAAMALIGLLLTIFLVITSYNDLPDMIPRHYAGNGLPDIVHFAGHDNCNLHSNDFGD